MKAIKLNNKADSWIVLLHGYGADAEDLSSLRFQMGIEKKLNWLFPQGEINTAGNEGRAWFRIPQEELKDLQASQPHSLTDESRPPGVKKARESLRREIEKLRIPWEKVILGGFSQGAMLATDLALSLTEPCRGLVLFSTGPMALGAWSKKLAAHKALRVFISHGQSDKVIHPNESKLVEKLFQEQGIEVESHMFEGGHEIPVSIAYKAGAFIKKL